MIGQIVLTNMDDTGFKATGMRSPASEPGQEATFVTGAYPNQMQAIAIKNGFAYLPNVGASPNGPVAFNVSTQALVHILDTTTNQDTGLTINLHAAVAAQPEGTRKLFLAIPWAIAFKNHFDEGYVVSAASNVLVKIVADPTTGALTVQNNPMDGSVLEIPVGRNPRGIVINNADTRAYVMNYISRDVTVLDLTRFPEQVIATLRSTALPAAGSLEELILVGKELYNTSVGEFTQQYRQYVQRRLAGVRLVPSLRPVGQCGLDFRRRAAPDDLAAHRLHRRDAAGAQLVGYFRRGTGLRTEYSRRVGRRGTAAQCGWHGPGSDRQYRRAADWRSARAGRAQFAARSTAGAHAVGQGWSRLGCYRRLHPDDPRADLAAARQHRSGDRGRPPDFHQQQLPGVSRRTALVEQQHHRPDHRSVADHRRADHRANCAMSARSIRPTSTKSAPTASRRWVRHGFVPPSLLSVFAVPPYFHNGAAASLDEVLSDKFIAHRSAGTGGIDGLSNPEDRRKLVKFLLSIDASTEPINP